MAGREWGFWTREKLDLLRRYLDAFTTASQRLDEIVYLDLFAGEAENYDRLTGEHLQGSARIALETSDPPFTRLRFFELERNASALEEALRSQWPDRDFVVYPGDCNETVHAALDHLKSVAWAPTFAFIDPNGTDVKWETLEALARHKTRSPYKVELWMLFPAGLFMRNLPRDSDPRPKDATALDELYGNDQWRITYSAYRHAEIDGAEARDEYVNLFRWRLENALGYAHTHAFDVRNEGNTSIYHLVFATDNAAGNRIMSSLYGTAAREFPAMRAEARRMRQELKERESGVQQLFELGAIEDVSDEHLYEHRPPSVPRGHYDDET